MVLRLLPWDCGRVRAGLPYNGFNYLFIVTINLEPVALDTRAVLVKLSYVFVSLFH